MSPESTLGTKITSNVDTSETTPEDSQIGKEGWKPKVSLFILMFLPLQ